jgi:hypothetical protein
MKYCPRCNIEKSLSMFGKCQKNRDGRTCYCLECCNEMTKASYAKHGEEIRARRRERYAAKKAGRVKEYKPRKGIKALEGQARQAARLEQARRTLIAIGFLPATAGD